MTTRKIYLAGPDVFARDARQRGLMLKDICAQFDCVGLWPADNDVSTGLSPTTRARQIFDANRKMIAAAGAVVANIQPFRGPHLDAGTAWEIGMAYALGKRVFAYTDPGHRELKNRIRAAATSDGWRDIDGWLVEDFGHADNLMIACSVVGTFDTARDAVRAATAWLVAQEEQ